MMIMNLYKFGLSLFYMYELSIVIQFIFEMFCIFVGNLKVVEKIIGVILYCKVLVSIGFFQYVDG